MATPQSEFQKRVYAVAEYLEFERQAEDRHEFTDGEIGAMAGESLEHSEIGTSLSRFVSTHLLYSSCRVTSPNMRTGSGEQINANSSKGLFSYYDLGVVCGEPKFQDKFRDVLANPKVLFEILSSSTGSYDRGEKFRRYRTYNDSLTDYVLVWQTPPLIERFERQPNNPWLMTEVKGLDSALHTASIDCRLKLTEVYDRISFQAREQVEAPAEAATEDAQE